MFLLLFTAGFGNLLSLLWSRNFTLLPLPAAVFLADCRLSGMMIGSVSTISLAFLGGSTITGRLGLGGRPPKKMLCVGKRVSSNVFVVITGAD